MMRDDLASIKNTHLKDNFTYFESLIMEAIKNGRLDDSDHMRVQTELIMLLARMCNKYDPGSSSIRIERAQSIMSSILFTLDIFLKKTGDPQHALRLIIDRPLQEIYQKGRSSIEIKLLSAKHLYSLVQENRIQTKNIEYNWTIEKGIPCFFESYDPDYAAQETFADIDYPLQQTVVDLRGVEYISEYLYRFLLENIFLSRFPAEDLHRLLISFARDYQYLLLNIFEIVLYRVFALGLLQRKVGTLFLANEDIEDIAKELDRKNPKQVEADLLKLIPQILFELKIDDSRVKGYIIRTIPEIAFRLDLAVQNMTLGKTLYVYEAKH